MKPIAFLLGLGIVFLSACDDLVEEQIRGTLSGRIEFESLNDEWTGAEVDVSVCSVEDLCDRWENVKKIEVTAITYEIVWLSYGTGIDFVSIEGAVSYREGSAWTYLNDFTMADISERVGVPTGIPLAEGEGETLGAIIKDRQNLGIRIAGVTSDPLLLKVDVFVNVTITVGL